jgi:rhodanese-related sulfurtransferase
MTHPNRTAIPSITPAEAWRRMREEGAALIDVREPDEYQEGHAQDAVSIPLSEFRERYTEVPRTGDALFICHTGQRSLMAAMFIQRQGWDHAINVEGGTDEWEASHLPMQR